MMEGVYYHPALEATYLMRSAVNSTPVAGNHDEPSMNRRTVKRLATAASRIT